MIQSKVNNKIYNKKEIILPLLSLRGGVLFPNSIMSLDISRSSSINAMEAALESENNLIFLVMQKDIEIENPEPKDLYKCGTVARILQKLRISINMTRIIITGIERGVIKEFIYTEPFIQVQINLIQDAEIYQSQKVDKKSINVDAMLRVAREQFQNFAELYGKIPKEVIFEVLESPTIGEIADSIGANIPIKINQQQEILEELNDIERLKKTLQIMEYENKVLEVKSKIYDKVKFTIDKNQQEYILHEQIKAIKEELGEKIDNEESELYRKRIFEAHLPLYVQEKLLSELKRMERSTMANSRDASVERDYIERVLDLPWHNKTIEKISLQRAKTIFANEHYGLEKVKERILEFIAVRQTHAPLSSPIICLVGPPGVGKTSIAKSAAKTLNRKYARICLSGIRDEAEIRGHRKTYVGAMPGRIIECLRTTGSKNPLILLDEIDKMSSDYRGNPAYALLEALDEEQNFEFRDHYLEIPFDLSDVLFFCTANTIEGIPQPLLDRLEIIEILNYSIGEKCKIAEGFLLPKQLKKHGLHKSQMRIYKGVINDIISFYTKEAGVRQLERLIASLCRKTVKKLCSNEKKGVNITRKNLVSFLGKKKYLFKTTTEIAEIGVCCGLAWTATGGDIFYIEVNIIKGTGTLKITGNVGKVMKESAEAAVSYIRSISDQLELKKDFYEDIDIHIHIPEGATPKDGPSAGITMATALASALTKIPIDNLLAMSGEITIRGRVLPIGGLKEKLLAAQNAGIKKILLPWENKKDLCDITDDIKEGLDFILIKTMDEVLDNALLKI